MTLMTMAAAGAMLGPAPAVRADLMAACSPEVAQFCADVRQGRGRIVACLASHRGELGPGCRPEVQAVARRTPMPGYARKVLDPTFRADLPPACVAAAARYCPRVPPGDGRVFACLYARSDRVGASCTAAADAALERN
jgi:Cysteine rich repeat